MSPVPKHVDHQQLIRKVQQVVDLIERDEGDVVTVHCVAEEIIDKLSQELGLYGARLYQQDGDSYVLRATYPSGQEAPHGIRISSAYTPIEMCLSAGTLYMDSDDPRIDPELEAELGVKEFAAVELDEERYVLGFSVRPGHDPEDILFSLGVVRRAINAKLRQRRLDDVLGQARQIQASILPRQAPEFTGYDLAGYSASMETVGGDLFDFIDLSDKTLGIAIADASGHGLPAALQVRDIHVGLRMGLERDYKIVRTIERLNQVIHGSTLTSRFVSLFYGELERNGMLIYVNAGHPPPIHLKGDGTLFELEEGGPVLGPLADATYDRGFARLEPGDVLVLYTDGVTEVLRDGDSERGEEFGFDRLVEVIRRRAAEPAKEILRAIYDALAEWGGAAPPQDDRTAVVLRVP